MADGEIAYAMVAGGHRPPYRILSSLTRYGYGSTTVGLLLALSGLLIAGHLWSAGALLGLTLASTREAAMAKKSAMSKAADAVKTVAGTALGAAAAAATAVVIESVTDAMTKGSTKLEEAGPTLQKSAADVVSKPIKPASKSKSARAKSRKPVARRAKRSASAAKKKVAAKKKHR